VSNINFDIWFFLWSGGLYENPMKNILRRAKFLNTCKSPCNTFDLNPKGSRTLPFFIYFSWDIYRDPPLHRKKSNIKVDI
jgi:hypothetical protein